MKTICQFIFGSKQLTPLVLFFNRVMIRSSLDKTPYKLWKSKKLNISDFKFIGSKCFILNTKDNLRKIDEKFNVGIFI